MNLCSMMCQIGPKSLSYFLIFLFKSVFHIYLKTDTFKIIILLIVIEILTVHFSKGAMLMGIVCRETD